MGPVLMPVSLCTRYDDARWFSEIGRIVTKNIVLSMRRQLREFMERLRFFFPSKNCGTEYERVHYLNE